MQRITTEAQLDKALESNKAVLFKHSTRCSISSWVKKAVTTFGQDNPGCPVFVLHVIEDRPLSKQVEAKTGIRHESPQAFFVRSGKVAKSASHFDVEKLLTEAASVVA